LRKIILILSIFITTLTVGFILAIALSAVALSRKETYYDPYFGVIQSTTTLRPTTSIRNLFNTCVDKSYRLYNFTQNELIPKDVFTKYFSTEIIAVVEVCVPNISFLMHLGSKLVMIEEIEFKEIKSSGEINLVWNLKKILCLKLTFGQCGNCLSLVVPLLKNFWQKFGNAVLSIPTLISA
jgi:hypothetical protein